MVMSCTGVRGGLFTVAMTRFNVRIRTSLFDALMRQEIAFFTSTKTGENSLPPLCGAHPCLACIPIGGRCCSLENLSAVCFCRRQQVRHFRWKGLLLSIALDFPVLVCRRDHKSAVCGHHHGVRPDLPKPECGAAQPDAGGNGAGVHV